MAFAAAPGARAAGREREMAIRTAIGASRPRDARKAVDRLVNAGVEVARNMGGSALFAACDVTNADEVTAALEAAVAKLGAVHVLVAGLAGGCAPDVRTGEILVGSNQPLEVDLAGAGIRQLFGVQRAAIEAAAAE